MLAAHTLPLSPRDKQLHEWAAKGLAHTCWVTYWDQVSGLGPDEMTMEPWPGETHAGRWIEHVEAWEREGGVGGVPPGLHDVPREEEGKRDYYPTKRAYLLRPEVCCTLPISSLRTV
jgi:mannosyl-oligosaccharide alpha-1,2-mannosidase